jgi:hypothetical protein
MFQRKVNHDKTTHHLVQFNVFPCQEKMHPRSPKAGPSSGSFQGITWMGSPVFSASSTGEGGQKLPK